MTILLQVTGLTKQFAEKVVVDGIEFSLEKIHRQL